VTVENPQHRTDQITAAIRADILSGVYAPGSVLPSQNELAARYGVSRNVVLLAQRPLRTEGLLTGGGPGHPTRIRPVPVITSHRVARQLPSEREAAGNRGAFDGEMRRLGLTPRVDVTVGLADAPAAVAEILGQSRAVTRRRLMYANDYPVQLATSWIPADIAEGTPIAQEDTGPGGIMSRLADLGYPQTRITETVRTRQPTTEEAALLDLAKGQEVTEIQRAGWTAAGRAVEVNQITVPATLWELTYEWELT
jgi:GntR family transcriptional regulator